MPIEALFDLLIIGLVRGGMYVLMAMGLTLILGVINVPNFAHGEFYMLGAYFAYFASVFLRIPSILVIAVAALGGFISGMIIEKAVFYPLRRRSEGKNWLLNSFLLTVGLSITLQNLALWLIGSDYRGITSYWGGSLSIGGLMISQDRVIGFIIAMVSVLIFWLFLTRTKTGNSIRAVSENARGAKLVGIDLNRIYTLTFGLGAMMASIAGATLLSINPAYPTMGLRPLFRSWFVVILVGLGNVGGTIIGGFIVGLLETASYYGLGSGWQDVVSLTVIIFILIFKPSGLFGKAVKGIWEQ